MNARKTLLALFFTWMTSSSWTPAYAVCGDSTLDGADECDDGNTTSGDGCSASCTIETNFKCIETTAPSVCSALSGAPARNSGTFEGHTDVVALEHADVDGGQLALLLQTTEVLSHQEGLGDLVV